VTHLAKLAAGATVSAIVLIAFAPPRDAVTAICKPALARAELKHRAVGECALRGVNVAGWSFAAVTEFARPTFEAYVLHPDDPWARDRRGFLYRVTFREHGSAREARLILSAAGSVVSFSRDPGETLASLDTAGPLADAEFRRLAGPLAGLYRPVSRGTAAREGLHFSWEAAGPSNGASVSRITTLVDARGVLRSMREEDIPESMRGELVKKLALTHRYLTPFTLAFYYVGVTAAFWMFFMLLGRNPAHLKFGLRLAVLLSAIVAIDVVSGSTLDSLGASPAYAELSDAARWGNKLLGEALGVMLLCVALSAGYGLSGKLRTRAWTGIHLASRGRFWSAEVGLQTLAAALGGVVLAVLISAPAWLPGAPAGTAWVGSRWILAAPVLDPLAGIDRAETVGIFGFALPLLAWLWNRRNTNRRPWREWLIGILVVLIVVFNAASNAASAYSLFGATLGAILVLGCLYWLYHSFGMWTVWLAWPFAAAWNLALLRANLPDPARHAEAAWLLGGWGGVAIASLLAWRLAPQHAEEAERQILEELGQPSRSERDWLNAQFHVARQAQTTMMPSETPKHRGFSIAVSSTPAREVGGDLYDFLEISQHRKCFLLGDVSGKGVAAALYMTLTKGMLAAASAESLELPGLFERLNRHFTASGHRRMFLTLSGGVMDGESLTLTHLRAGHPPALLCRAADGSCDWLKPRGIGIGLVSGSTFSNTLELEVVQLEPGDVVVYYSDGLSECMNLRQEQFGEERIQATVLACREDSAEAIETKLRETAGQFRGPAEPHDDLTILVVKVSGNRSGTPATPLC